MDTNEFYQTLAEIESIPQDLLKLGISSYIKRTQKLKEKCADMSCIDDILCHHSKSSEKRFRSSVGFSKQHVRIFLQRNPVIRDGIEKQVKSILYGSR